MALDKVLKIYDEQGNSVDYDILASDVKFLPDGKDLPTKLTEMEDAIEDAAESGGYEPPEGGIPKTDLAPSVQTSLGLADTALQEADKIQLQAAINAVQTALNNLMNGQNVTDAIDTFNEVKAFLDGIDTDDPTLANQLLALNNAISALQTALAGKISGIKANGASETLPVVNGIVELPPAGSTISPATATPSMDGTAIVGSSDKYAREDHVHPHDSTKLSKSDVSVETQGDGTVDINVKDDTYTINLNHTHEGMAKLVKCTEATLPQTLADDTIYVQVDDLETPGEIQKLYLFGVAFEGGGGVIDETPRLTSPAVGTEIDFSGQSSTTLRVKGLYLSSQLTVTKSGDIAVTANGSAVSTISATDANNGIELTITKGANFSNEDCSLTFASSEVSRTVVVKDSRMLPGGLFADMAWATRETVQTPVELSGYCITKFRVPRQASGRMKVSVKAGFTTESSGLDYIGCALNKGADNNTNFTSTDVWWQRTDPRLYTPAAGDGTAISATFKTSEIANCYIYDHNAGQYLWAGENVDTSVAPPIPSNV